MSTSTGPDQVLIIRHGEKLGDPSADEVGGPDLSIRGSARAAALSSLFVPDDPSLACVLATAGEDFNGNYATVAIKGSPPRFPTPDFLFATRASNSSNRPVETITPLASALKLDVDANHANGDYTKVATDILSKAKYAGKVVLVCWHHGNIQALAQALGVADAPHWKGHIFDRVWQITLSGGAATLDDLPQLLLFGDSNT